MAADDDFAEMWRLTREMLFAFLALDPADNAAAYADPEIRRIGEEIDRHGAPERAVTLMATSCMYLIGELERPGVRASDLVLAYQARYGATSQAPPDLVLGCFQMLHAAGRRDAEMGLAVSRALVERYHADAMFILAMLCKDLAGDIGARHGRDPQQVLSDMALRQELDVQDDPS